MDCVVLRFLGDNLRGINLIKSNEYRETAWKFWNMVVKVLYLGGAVGDYSKELN